MESFQVLLRDFLCVAYSSSLSKFVFLLFCVALGLCVLASFRGDKTRYLVVGPLFAFI